MSLAKTVTIGSREITVPLTIVDKIVNYFNPIRGAERYRTRLQMAISGGYTSADRTRRANQKGFRAEMDADTAILPDLATLRAESQNLYRNSGIAGGAINVNVTKVVGTGLKVKSQIDRTILKLSDEQADAFESAAEREFLLCTETREFDCERQLPLSLQQGLVFLKSLEDGDIFINLPRFSRPGSPYKIKAQMIEAARVSNPKFAVDTSKICGGIERDQHGAPDIAYVSNIHPGSVRGFDKSKITWTPYKLFSSTGSPLMIHFYDKRRCGQTRGVPYLAPVIEIIKQLGRYTDAEVMAAVVTGMLTVFITSETGSPAFGPAPTQSNPTGDRSKQSDQTGLELGYGSVIGLRPNEKPEIVNPLRPNSAFDPFFLAIVRQIGMALELPFEVLVKHFTASYSAAQAALEEAWAYFRRRRHQLVSLYLQPIYEEVIAEAVSLGRLSAPGFFADPMIRKAYCGSTWVGDAQAQIDQVKAITAAAKRVELTISTLDEESRKLTGTSWEDKLPQVLREREILRQAGITIPVLEIVATEAAPPPQNTDDEQTQEDTTDAAT